MRALLYFFVSTAVLHIADTCDSYPPTTELHHVCRRFFELATREADADSLAERDRGLANSARTTTAASVDVSMFAVRPGSKAARLIPVRIGFPVIGGDRRTLSSLATGVRATYHIGYEGRETSTLACADKIWASALYRGCGANGDARACKLLHYPWTATSIRGNPNTSGLCGRLVRVTDPATRRSVIVRVVDFGAAGPDYPNGGLDLEPAAFNALAPAGYLSGNVRNLVVQLVQNDW